MIQLRVSVDTRVVERALRNAQKQVPFALARALTMVAQAAVGDVRAEMRKVFHNPSAFTLKGFYAKPAKKNDLTAWVGAREFAAKGTPAAKYLAPQVFGGVRGFKRLELRVGNQAIGSSVFVVPGRGAQMANGQWSRGQIGRMLSGLQTFGDTGHCTACGF